MQFYLHIQDIEAKILRFDSKQIRFSQDFEIILEVLTDKELDINRLNEITRIDVVTKGNLQHFFTAIVTQIREQVTTNDGVHYHIQLNSPWYIFGLNQHSRVYVEQTVAEIVRDVIDKTNISSKHIALHLTKNYEPIPCYIQYQESDSTFLERLMAQHGLFFCYDFMDNCLVLNVYDDIQSLPAGSVKKVTYAKHKHLQRSTDSVLHYGQQGKCLSESVSFREHSRSQPQNSLAITVSRSLYPSHGVATHIDQHYRTQTQGEQRLLAQQQALESARSPIIATTDCVGLKLGQTMTITNTHNPKLKQAMRVVGIQHHYYDRQASPVPINQTIKRTHLYSYKNTVTLIPATQAYKTRLKTKRTHYSTISATIDNPGVDTANLTTTGNYHVSFPFDENKHEKGQGSSAISAAQANTGAGAGMHFLLRDGTQVLLECINGDINRPIILGVLANDSNQNPVTAQNASQYLWRTYGGHEIIMDDDNHNSHLRLNTRDEENKLRLQNGESPYIMLSTQKGDMHFHSAKVHSETVNKKANYTSGKDHYVTIAEHYHARTSQGDIAMTSAKNFTTTAKKCLLMQTHDGSANINVGNEYMVQATNCLQTSVGDKLLMQTQNGNIKLQAVTGIDVMGDKGFSIAQAGGLIAMDKDGNLSIKGTSINVKGKSINLNASQVQQGGKGQPAGLPRINVLPKHWIQARYVDSGGKPISQRPYQITSPDGSIHKGILDAHGRTVRLQNLTPGTANIVLGDKKTLEKQLSKEQQQLKRSLDKLLLATKRQAQKDKGKLAKENWFHREMSYSKAAIESFVSGAAHGVEAAGKGIIHLFADMAEVQALDDEGRYATLTRNTKQLDQVDQQMMQLGEREYGGIEKGIKLMHFLYQDKQTRVILEQFASDYYYSESKLMVTKQIASMTGGFICAIVVALILKKASAFAPNVAESTELVKSEATIDNIETTLTELDKCQELKAAALNREHKVTQNALHDGHFRTSPKALAKHLKSSGYGKNKRLEILSSFDLKNTKLRIAQENEYGLRYYDNKNAFARGRYLFKTFPNSREQLALKPEWNQMKHIKQWKIRPGSQIIEGPAAEQGIGYPGKALQIFVSNSDEDLLEP